ncbi:MAG: class I SAM-dependent methyltransferase [Victivallales bacterium]|nr:class I SAM-dependent methyltransferase [Victivallales bacterium]
MPKHLQKVIDHYTPLVSENAPGYRLLDWSSRETQFLRFQMLALELRRQFGKKPFRLLDVGCGVAELAPYLKSLGFQFEYTGVDITPAMLREARRRNPDLDIRELDVFAEQSPLPAGSFEVTFCSGVFNLRQDNSLDFAQRGLHRLGELASTFAMANFLHKRASIQYSACCYFTPEELLPAVVDQFETIVRDSYLENDFSVLLFPKERT